MDNLVSEDDDTDGGSLHEDWMNLHNAVYNLDVKAAEELLKHVADPAWANPDMKYRTLLHELALGFMASVQYDPERKAKQNIRFIDILTMLVQNGVSVNATDQTHKTALHLLVSPASYSDVIRVLLATGLKVNLQDSCQQTALHKSVVRGNLTDIEVLLDGGADPNILDCAGHTPLHLAVKRKHNSAIVQLLIRAGANTNARETSKNKRGCPPLHLAVKMGNLENVRILLRNGAVVDAIDNSGQAPIHLAAANDMTGRVLEVLHRQGASVNDQDTVLRETPLHKAVKRDMMDNFRYLVRCLANPNIRDDLNETVLHKAAACTNPFIWMNLMRLGGDVNIRNRSSLTPMDKAHKAKNHMAISIMKEYGTKHM